MTKPVLLTIYQTRIVLPPDLTNGPWETVSESRYNKLLASCAFGPRGNRGWHSEGRVLLVQVVEERIEGKPTEKAGRTPPEEMVCPVCDGGPGNHCQCCCPKDD